MAGHQQVGAQGPDLFLIVREWGRIGCTGFGGPPTHIKMLRDLCVTRRGWMQPTEFEDSVAACNLLPGPSSTQLAILCAWRARGRLGGIVGGLSFILPGLAVIMVFAWAFLATAPPAWLMAAGAGAGAVVPVVAVQAGASLIPASRKRTMAAGAGSRWRWFFYLAAGTIAAATAGPRLVLVLIGCGLVEVVLRRRPEAGQHAMTQPLSLPLVLAAGAASAGTLVSVAWVALKVGMFSYGGGFVIVPLMQADAVEKYHWMTAAQFLNAVALGQVTPGPVAQTVALVGFAAAGTTGALVASCVAFAPSFAFILIGARHFDQLRGNLDVRAFLDGAGPAAIGAILGSALVLLQGLGQPWQLAILAAGTLAMFAAGRGVLTTILGGAVLGLAAVALGAPLPG